MKRVIYLIIVMCMVCLFMVACGETVKEKKIAEAQRNNDKEALEKLYEEENNALCWYFMGNFYDENESVDKSDELQNVIYSFDCLSNKHTFTLNYEPLPDNDDIPAYKQKCICTWDKMPDILRAGDKIKINVNAEYIGGNEYAGITDTYWLYTDSDVITITNDDGYTSKEEVFVGNGKAGERNSLKTSFTISVPENLEDVSKDDFNIIFKSNCGKTGYMYSWKKYF